MKALLFVFTFFISSIVVGQSIKFKVDNYKDTTVHLVRYFGKGLYYADTAEIKNGVVVFDGKKHKPGILAFFTADQRILEFIYNNEEVSIETSYPDLMGSMKIKKSEENKIFSDYVHFMNGKHKEKEVLNAQMKGLQKDDPEYTKLKDQSTAINDAVEVKQKELIASNPNKLVSKIVEMSMEVKVPDAPKDENGKIIDSTFRARYYRDHYFDNFDFNDDRLVRTPIFHSKLAPYFSQEMMYPHCDTVIKYAFQLCDQLPEGSETYQYVVSWITSTYEKSKIMNMDKVFVWMAERYYCAKDKDGEPKAFWVPEKTLDKICEKANTNRNLVYGVRPPNIILRDSTDQQWKDFYSLKSEYTILYFWDPECGHCKKVTPNLQKLYAGKLKERNVEIFAVGKAVGEDFEKWKAFIKKNNLEFINVGVTDKLFKDASDKSNNQAKLLELLKSTTIESINYQQTYDIYATPRVFILDKDKKIIGKSLTVGQMEEFLDKLQGQADAPKMFPVEKEDPEESQVH